MHELFDALPRITMDRARHLKLLDTCFVIDMAKRRQLHALETKDVAFTTFNLEELAHIAHRLPPHIKHELREFFKKHPGLTVIDVPVHPGDHEGERAFVDGIDSSLLQKIRDPSDAVLLAAALKTGSDVYTKDKHHLFTTQLENYLRDIHVWKEWK